MPNSIPSMPDKAYISAVKQERAKALSLLISQKFGPKRGSITRTTEFLGVRQSNFTLLLQGKSNIPDNFFTRLHELPDYQAPEVIDIKRLKGTFSVSLNETDFRRARELASLLGGNQPVPLTNATVTKLVSFLIDQYHELRLADILAAKDAAELKERGKTRDTQIIESFIGENPNALVKGYSLPEGLKTGADIDPFE